jgi:hypothetical protein
MSQLALPVSEPVVEEPVLDAAAEDAAFDSGYTGDTEPAPTETTPPAAVVEPVVEPVVVPEPEFVQITKADWEKIRAETASVSELKQEVAKRFDTTFGKMGGLERTLTQLQQNTPAGQPIVVTEEDLLELKEEFPDLTGNLVKGLTRIVGKFKGTGPAPEIDVAGMVAPLVQQAVREQDEKFAKVIEAERLERLTDLHPNWREIAGAENSQTEYRTWLAKQPNGSKILQSDNPREIANSLTAFLDQKKQVEAQKATPQKANGRSQRLAEAVPAKGGSGSAPGHTQPSEDEQFEAGFKAGR